MTVYEYLNDLDQKGELRKLIRAGIVSIDYVSKIEIYRAFDALRRMRNDFKKKDCIDFVCNEKNVSFNTVDRVISEMRREFVE